MTVNRRPAVRSAAASRPQRTVSLARQFAALRTEAGRIEFYYRPMSNGWKSSVMFEECGLPYVARPVNIGIGPTVGQTCCSRQYVEKKIPYAIGCYTNEINRLFGVMNRRLRSRDYLIGRYSTANVVCWGWIVPYKVQGQQFTDFPYLKDRFERVSARPTIRRGIALGRNLRQGILGDKIRDIKGARKIFLEQHAQ